MQKPAEPPAAARLGYAEFVTLVALLMALNAMAIDIILPALQQMGASLQVADENARQLPLTAYIAVFGASQIFYGPFADRYGRRSVLLVGLAIYTLGSIGAVVATDFTMLLAMRGLQGLGAGASRVIAVAVIRDTYGGRRMASVMSLAMMVFMTVPVIAPTLGQGIAMVAGWRGILFAVAAFGLVIMVWCWLRLPETLKAEDRRELRPGPVLEAFRMVVTNRLAAAYGLGVALMFGCLFAFLNSVQQIYQEVYGIGAAFPLYFSFGAVFMALASFMNARVVERFGMRRLSHGALLGFGAASALLFLYAIANDGYAPFWAFYLLTLIAFMQFAFIGPNFNAIAMEPLGHIAGTASAVLGSLQTLVGGVIGAFVGYAFDGTLMPLALSFFVLAALNIGVVVIGERGKLFGGAPIVH